MKEDAAEFEPGPGEGAGSARAKDAKEEFLAQIIDRLNELFVMDELSNNEVLNFVRSVAQVAKLEAQIAMNSGSSSKPPSSDGFNKPPKPKCHRASCADQTLSVLRGALRG